MVHSINSFDSPSSMRGDEEKAVQETQEERNIDLNLSLSLNGNFGVDPQKNHTVSGSSSHSKVLITPHNRSSPISGEHGAESKMSHAFPTAGTEVRDMGTGRKEPQSLDSQGSNSSTISCFQCQCQTFAGPGYPANIGGSMNENQGNFVETVADNTSLEAIPADKVEGGVLKKRDMLRVFTIIDGRKLRGFLSEYDDEEKICIICLCHGVSMTPAEFIRHGGGGVVAHPMRHIFLSHAQGGGVRVDPLN